MNIPEIYFTIWWRPHRAWGYPVNIMSIPEDQNRVLGLLQSEAAVQGTSPPYPSFDPAYPHCELEVTVEAFLSLCRRADKLSYHFAEMHPFTQTGGSFYGLRLEQADQEFVVKWHGRFDDLQNEDIKDLHRQIQHIAGESYPS
jgi:hypothetical protein